MEVSRFDVVCQRNITYVALLSVITVNKRDSTVLVRHLRTRITLH